jgi:hypothetical protein
MVPIGTVAPLRNNTIPYRVPRYNLPAPAALAKFMSCDYNYKSPGDLAYVMHAWNAGGAGAAQRMPSQVRIEQGVLRGFSESGHAPV